VIDGAEEYRVEPGSRRDAGDQTNIFPVNAGRSLGDQVEAARGNDVICLTPAGGHITSRHH